MVALGGEAISATAGLDGVGVLEGEATFFETVVEVELGSIEEEIALLIDGDFDAVMFGDEVIGGIGGIDEGEAVLETAATTSGDSNAEVCFGGIVPLLHDSLDFFGRFFGEDH